MAKHQTASYYVSTTVTGMFLVVKTLMLWLHTLKNKFVVDARDHYIEMGRVVLHIVGASAENLRWQAPVPIDKWDGIYG
jgi:hypothetical protein